MLKVRKLLDKYKDIALSDDDIRKLMGGQANILVYRELRKYDNIDQILGDQGVCFILYEWKPHYGHWCVLTKHNNLIEFFDPYGDFPDSELDMVPEEFKKESGQDRPYLSDLLRKCKYDLSFNEYQFQELSKSVRDCGRWSCTRALLKELPLKDFKELFLNIYGDDLVTIITS